MELDQRVAKKATLYFFVISDKIQDVVKKRERTRNVSKKSRYVTFGGLNYIGIIM
ncbi:hypothetical protein Amet_1386 [Alkaliphilus metalliredigens QYMF]|uniref:Uncharacterized protein n=1 Tax=Alkaliphilus metalliredigens (strain QYMF) TaxID=293826 RepID=A6TN18_ALKMQ|nr:hypothetical protein Amet_1386 [Alkaliphilus metalliredigens QYMF]